MNLSGKNVVITGASSGIGAALALAFARQQAHLVLASRNLDQLEAVKQQCLQHTTVCHIVALDLARPEQIVTAATTMLSHFSQIHVLVNNAGISQRAKAAETQPEVEQAIMQTNYLGPIYLTKLLLPALQQAADSAIIAISSVVGLFGFPLRSSYAASKHALHGYFESMALENDQPHILLVCPGRINTPISLSALDSSGKQHGIQDPGQATGIPADVCAAKIVKALQRKRHLVLVARGERILWYIRRLSPALFRIISRRISAT